MNIKYLSGFFIFIVLYILVINYIIESNNCNNSQGICN